MVCPSCNEKRNFSRYDLCYYLRIIRFATYPTILVVYVRRFMLENWVPKKIGTIRLYLYIDTGIVVELNIDLEELRGYGKREDESELPDESDSPTKLLDKNRMLIIEQLSAMGFEKWQCVAAFKSSPEKDVESVMNYLLANMDSLRKSS